METGRLSFLAESGWADQVPHRGLYVPSIHPRQRPNLRADARIRRNSPSCLLRTSLAICSLSIRTHWGFRSSILVRTCAISLICARGTWNFHHNNIQLYAGRRELKSSPITVEPGMDSLGILVMERTRTTSMSSAPRLLPSILLRWTRTEQD
jgi:hypothetical protein